MPNRETVPYVGLMPLTPHKAAGWRTEPPVSVPVAAMTRPAATALADPPEDPPGIMVGSHGFLAGPKAEFLLPEPMANSSQLRSEEVVEGKRVSVRVDLGGRRIIKKKKK